MRRILLVLVGALVACSDSDVDPVAASEPDASLVEAATRDAQVPADARDEAVDAGCGFSQPTQASTCEPMGDRVEVCQHPAACGMPNLYSCKGGPPRGTDGVGRCVKIDGDGYCCETLACARADDRAGECDAQTALYVCPTVAGVVVKPKPTHTCFLKAANRYCCIE